MNGRLADDGDTLVVSFNANLVLVSFAIAFLGGYVAVSLADQFRIAYELKPKFMKQGSLLVFMAISIGGIAIWAMHFVGMGAMTLKTRDGAELKKYVDPVLTVLSMLLAIALTYVGILIASHGREYSKDRAQIFAMILKNSKNLSVKDSRSKFTVWRIALLKGIGNVIVGGVITAAGVCVMHYVGMIAFLKDAETHWNAGIVFASVIIAVIAASAAFWILFSALPLRPDMEILRVLSGLIAAVAVCGMHYTGMMAATYTYKYDSHQAFIGEETDMETASWAAMVSGMGFLWVLVIFIVTDLRAWHLTLDKIVTKTDEMMADLNTSALKVSGRDVYCSYQKYRKKLVERRSSVSTSRTRPASVGSEDDRSLDWSISGRMKVLFNGSPAKSRIHTSQTCESVLCSEMSNNNVYELENGVHCGHESTSLRCEDTSFSSGF